MTGYIVRSLFFAWKYCTAPINGNFIVKYFEQTVNVGSFNFCFRFLQKTDRNPVAGKFTSENKYAGWRSCGREGDWIVSVNKEYCRLLTGISRKTEISCHLARNRRDMTDHQYDTGRHLLQDEDTFDVCCPKQSGSGYIVKNACNVTVSPKMEKTAKRHEARLYFREIIRIFWKLFFFHLIYQNRNRT